MADKGILLVPEPVHVPVVPVNGLYMPSISAHGVLLGFRIYIQKICLALITLININANTIQEYFSFKSGNLQKAIDYYTAALKNVPDNPKILSNRAACFHKLELPELCIQVILIILTHACFTLLYPGLS